MQQPNTDERDYVLGTHDDEVKRLALQHRVWASRMLDAFARAGLRQGQTVVDIGAGPGFATLDLADVVGSAGRVIAVERSRRFLDVLERERDRRGLSQIVTHLSDLDADPLPVRRIHAAWSRWVLAFVKRPRALVASIASALEPGGVFVAHEYGSYAAWRLLPRSADFEEFVAAVMTAWRDEGGDPDVGTELPAWLDESGVDVVSVQPILDVASPHDDKWRWLEAFVRVGLDRLAALGRLSPARAGEILRDFERRKGRAGIRCVTPLVLETIAVKRA